MTYKEAFDIQVEPGQSVMAKLDQTGDTKILWTAGNEIEMEIARAAFDKAKKEGYMAYKVTGKDGAKGEIMHAFDPAAERVILTPAMRGGR